MLFDFGIPIAALTLALFSVLWVRHEGQKLDDAVRQKND
ncbi:hypothetical protein PARU111607_14130 [Palleronia rufa]